MNGIPPNTMIENITEIELCLENLISIDSLMKLTSLKILTVSNCIVQTIPKDID